MKTDHITMLCDISELNSLFEEKSLDDILQRLVDMVAGHMNAQVCSIYLYDNETEELVLKATHGLKKESINIVRMSINEGICGQALREQRTIYEKVGSSNPNYKYYPHINEELYEVFLAVPIIRGVFKIGVIVVQREKNKVFSEKDILAMKATASQLATTMENIHLIVSKQKISASKPKINDFSSYNLFKGHSASQGHGRGTTKQLAGRMRSYLYLSNGSKALSLSIKDFDNALNNTETQLEKLQEKIEEKLSDAASLIFTSHILMLKDPEFTGSIRDHIVNGMNPIDSVKKVFNKYKELFSTSDNLLVREKVQDIEDISARIIENMLSQIPETEVYSGHIIIAREIYPSDFLKYASMDIAGMVLASGGVTSHVSILSRSLHIPLILINDTKILDIPDDTPALLDADNGNLYINPTDEIKKKFSSRDMAAHMLDTEKELLRKPLCTRDGYDAKVLLNVNLLSDLSDIVVDIIDGIGLYRTEFPFIIRNTFPSEEEQYVIYRKLVESVAGKTITIRTLDIGGDKILSYYDTLHEANPFLGMRSIRFSLTHEDIFRQQLRAILRAGVDSDIRIMFPMISSIDEFISARSITCECIEELKNMNIPLCSNPAIGLMVEIPSAVAIIDDLAREADFLSIGTNDLIQYTLAVDRTNEKVSDMYIPHHPAVLRSLKAIAEAGKKYDIDVSICGDMGNSEEYIPFLLGIGITHFSVDALYISRVQKCIRKTSMTDAQKLAVKALALSSCSEIIQVLRNEKRKI